MGDNLDLPWIEHAENEGDDSVPDWDFSPLQPHSPLCQLCGKRIEYPFKKNWVAWCRKCARERWEEVSAAIMRLRDDG